jgi:hypothetical protein
MKNTGVMKMWGRKELPDLTTIMTANEMAKKITRPKGNIIIHFNVITVPRRMRNLKNAGDSLRQTPRINSILHLPRRRYALRQSHMGPHADGLIHEAKQKH